MDVKPIKTGADYRATLDEIDALMMAEPGSPDGEKLDVLVTLVEAYEKKHYPLDFPDPVEAIKFVRASLRTTDQEEQKLGALRQALIDGENSGESSRLDMQDLIKKARKSAGLDT